MIPKSLIAAAGIAALAVTVPAVHAQAPGARTFKLVEVAKRTKTTFVDTGKKGASPGDVVTLVIPLVDEAGAKAGTISAACTVSATPKAAEPPTLCHAVYALEDGDLAVVGRLAHNPSQLAIVGGTGAYAGARGTVAVTSADAAGGEDVVTLLP